MAVAPVIVLLCFSGKSMPSADVQYSAAQLICLLLFPPGRPMLPVTVLELRFDSAFDKLGVRRARKTKAQ